MAIDEDRLSETFAALANSTRRAILARLAEGEASVKDLSAPFEMSQPAISKHLRVLERAGLVIRGQRAQYRPCALDAAALEVVSTVIAVPPTTAATASGRRPRRAPPGPAPRSRPLLQARQGSFTFGAEPMPRSCADLDRRDRYSR